MSQQRTKSGPFSMADFLLMRTSGRSAFSRTCLVTGCLMLVSSCLSPQSIEQEEDAPRLPPEIIAKSITPDSRFVCIDGTTSTTFHLNVLSPDGRQLFVRWFVDYDPNVTSTRGIRGTTSPDPNGDGTLPISVDFDQSELGSVPQAENPHTVEVVIATAFDQDPKAFPPGRAIASGAYSASYKWVVVSAQERCSQ